MEICSGRSIRLIYVVIYRTQHTKTLHLVLVHRTTNKGNKVRKNNRTKSKKGKQQNNKVAM